MFSGEEFNWATNRAVSKRIGFQVDASCWAWGIVGAVEGLHYILTGESTRLSPQHLVDCVPHEHLSAEEFARMTPEQLSTNRRTNACRYIKDHGVTTLDRYPYIGRRGNCHVPQDARLLRIGGHQQVEPNNEDALMAALLQQPITVSIFVKSRSDRFVGHKHGIFYDREGIREEDKCNHVLLLVGYGTDPGSGHDYWIVKNSWGRTWGKDGFGMIRRGVNIHKGVRGILNRPIYPIGPTAWTN